MGLLALALGTAPAARAADVSVLVVPRFPPAEYAGRGAVGLFVPGSGRLVSRQGALASLLRGKVRNSVIGGVPSGPPLIALALRPAAITIFLALPPPGRHANTRRYPIAIVGGGYHGLLTSSSTRIPGLVSIADVATTSQALERGREPAIRSRPEADAPARLARLDERMTRAHAARLSGTLVLACSVFAGALLAFAFHSRFLSRAGLLAAPAALGVSLALSISGVTKPWLVVTLLALLTVAGSLAIAVSERLLLPAMVALLVAYLVVLVGWTDLNSLALIGPHPDGGGRFYGSTNLTSGVMLTVTLLAGRIAGLAGLAPLALLALVTVGWSRAGADGGGLVMFAAALAVLALRLSGARLTIRLLLISLAAVVAAGLALVGIDAATGGSSHVTHASGRGPGYLLGELGHRIHISAASVTSSWHAGLVFAAAVGALVWLGTRRPRFPAGDALLVGVAVSLVVNDTPTDAASAGALSYAVLWTWERLRPLSRPATTAATVQVDVPRVSPRA